MFGDDADPKFKEGSEELKEWTVDLNIYANYCKKRFDLRTNKANALIDGKDALHDYPFMEVKSVKKEAQPRGG